MSNRFNPYNNNGGNGFNNFNNGYNNNGFNNQGYNNQPTSAPNYQQNTFNSAPVTSNWGGMPNSGASNNIFNQQPAFNNNVANNGYELFRPGIYVDNSYIGDFQTVAVVENPDTVLANSDVRLSSSKILSNDILTLTTIRILHTLRNNTPLGSDKGLGLTSKSGWQIVFNMDTNEKLLNRRPYITRGTGVYNPLIEDIRQAVSADSGNPGKVSGINDNISYNSAFSSISSATNAGVQTCIDLYIDHIYNFVKQIENVFTNPLSVKRLNSGDYVISKTLKDFMLMGNISVAGINIKPIMSTDPRTKELIIDFQFEFSEELTIKYKGDLDRDFNKSLAYQI